MLTHYRDKVLRLLPFLLALLAALLTLSGLLLRLDFWLYDGLIRLKSNHNQTSDIVVVAVDERSLSELGRWPWPREYHAQLVDKLAQAGVHTRDDLADLAIDELTDITGQTGDEAKALIMKAREHWFADGQE